ncbi:hypothetical protein U91I_03399 [alpha proteobacterium U9-1i]|nr:hypothetical protein U91I_03399 [alpha proteobacterium U9-1i]
MSDVAVPANTNTPASHWWVQVRGQAYGPYALDQLHRFVEEGRIRPATPVSDKPEAGWVEARRVPGLLAPLMMPKDTKADAADELANVFVSAELLSGAWPRFMAAMKGMGSVCDLSPGLWLVRTRFSAGVIRNTLSQTLDRGDRFVVIDATRDRLAWFNLGPEVDVKINQVWNK